MRAVRGACLATPAAALLVCAPWHLTRFAVLKTAVACVGVLLAALALAHTRRLVSSGAALVTPSDAPEVCVARWGWWGLIGWGALSLTWSPDPGRGAALWLLWLLAGLWALVLGSALVADGTRSRPTLRRQLAWTWLGAAALAAGLALVQRGDAARLGLHRVTATLGNPNVVAVTLVLCLPLAVLLARSERRPGLRRLAWALAGLLVSGVLVTGCRAALVALAAQGLFWAFSQRGSRPFRAATLALVLVVGGLAGSTRPLARQASRAVAGRSFIAQVSARVMAQRPVRGTGLGGYGERAAWVQGALLRERPALRDRWSHLADAHNQVLMVGGELGLVGLAAWLLLLGPPLWLLVRRRRSLWACNGLAAWIGLAICGLTETVLLSPVALLLAFGWLVLGVVSDPGSAGDVSPARGAPGAMGGAPPWRQRARVAMILMLAGLGAALSISQLLAQVHLGRGLRRLGSPVDRTQLLAAERDYDRGLRGVGAKSALRFQRALVRRELGDLVRAQADMRRAFDLQPSPARALFLGDVHLARGDVAGGIRWYRQALRLHPRYQRAYNNLGVALLRAGRRAEACANLLRARSLLPGSRAAQRNVRDHCATARSRGHRASVRTTRSGTAPRVGHPPPPRHGLPDR